MVHLYNTVTNVNKKKKNKFLPNYVIDLDTSPLYCLLGIWVYA